MLLKKISVSSDMTPTLHLQTSFKVTVYPLNKGTMWVTYGPDLSKGRADMLRTFFLYNSTMTFTFDLENWYQVTTNPLFINSVK